MSEQLKLFPEPIKAPKGFLYIPEFIDQFEEYELLKIIKDLPFESFEMHGVEARRKIVHFGQRYSFLSRSISGIGEFPDWLKGLKYRSEMLLQNEVGQILITHYPPDAGIGWHLDAPPFESLLGISLKGSCRWQMRKGEVKNWEKFEIELPARSAYVVKGESRWLWEHHIPPVKSDRYSITFRTLKS